MKKIFISRVLQSTKYGNTLFFFKLAETDKGQNGGLKPDSQG